MYNNLCLIFKSKNIFPVLRITLAFLVVVAGAYASFTGSHRIMIVAAETVHENELGTSDNALLVNRDLGAPVLTSLTAQGSHSASSVYSVDPDPAEPKPRPDQDPDLTEHSKIKSTIDQNKKASGSFDIPAGATISLKDQPGKGTANVKQDGSWEYSPEPGFSGEDQFRAIIVSEDGSEEIITVEVLVAEVLTETVAENVETDSGDTLPPSGGYNYVAIVALWLFILASYSLRFGMVKE